MTINLVHFCIFWLNATPMKTGISSIYSHRELISHQKSDAKKCCKLMFAEYSEVHKENTTTNTMTPRARPAICMGPTGNIQGSMKFMRVETGKKIFRRIFTRLPMPDLIEKLAKKDRAENGINFRNRQKETFEG